MNHQLHLIHSSVDYILSLLSPEERTKMEALLKDKHGDWKKNWQSLYIAVTNHNDEPF
jgi:hypothetical protein